MRTITVVAKDYTGLMADITEVLGKANINIDKITADKIESTALIKLISDNVDEAYQILVDSGFHVVSQAGLLLKLKDEAGALARVSRTLAEHQIDIRGINMVEQHDGSNIVAISCSNTDKAREVLGELVI